MKFALSHARGRYFLWACQDDYWEADFLGRLVQALEQSPTAVCAQGGVRWFSADGTRSRNLTLYGRDLPEQQTRINLAVSLLTRLGREGQIKVKNSIFTHGLWNRNAFATALAAHRKPFSNERQILCQLALAGEFRYVNKILYHKTFYDVELDERYPATDATVIAKQNSNRWSELLDTLTAIIRSPIVPANMKIRAVPVLFLIYCRHRMNLKKRLSRRLGIFWRVLSIFRVRRSRLANASTDIAKPNPSSRFRKKV